MRMLVLELLLELVECLTCATMSLMHGAEAVLEEEEEEEEEEEMADDDEECVGEVEVADWEVRVTSIMCWQLASKETYME